LSILESKIKGGIWGLIIGDALGVTNEFTPKGGGKIVDDMVGGGVFNLLPGQWTDDTSMMLCQLVSYIEKGDFDPHDQMNRYVMWYRQGYLSSTGECFDIGGTTRWALTQYIRNPADPFAGPMDYNSSGNGSLMRLAPTPMFFVHDFEKAVYYSGLSSKTTHGSELCVDACRYFGGLIWGAVNGYDKTALLEPYFSPVEGFWKANPLNETIAHIASGIYKNKKNTDINGSGFVVESLEAALWCFHSTDNYRDCVLAAVNLGQDADTTAAVAGQLAGAFYGYEQLPEKWLRLLARKHEIEDYVAKFVQLVRLRKS
jgi:ADP-ribosylglycohydrolase